MVLEEHGQSKLTVRVFCQREGLSEPSFYSWRKKIAKRDAAAVFVPVELIDADNNDGVQVESVLSDRLEILTPGGFALRFFHATNTNRLSELLGAILRIEDGAVSC
ncbi:MAG TPA: hypothetical protein EYQ75_17715 [Planctomycetaceae bacterium]|nr:hypothetical protein [Planctomycetaceae bacterium]